MLHSNLSAPLHTDYHSRSASPTSCLDLGSNLVLPALHSPPAYSSQAGACLKTQGRLHHSTQNPNGFLPLLGKKTQILKRASHANQLPSPVTHSPLLAVQWSHRTPSPGPPWSQALSHLRTLEHSSAHYDCQLLSPKLGPPGKLFLEPSTFLLNLSSVSFYTKTQ